MYYQDNRILAVKRIHSSVFKMMFTLTGRSFKAKRKSTIAFIIFFIKLTWAIIVKMYYFSDRPLITFINDSSMDMVPLIEFTYLHFNLRHLNKQFNDFYEHFHITASENLPFIKKSRKFNCFSSLFILIMYTGSFAVGFCSLFDAKRGWVVMQVFPVQLLTDETFESIIASTVFIYQSFITNYIALSTCFYLSYLKMLLNCKDFVLRNIDLNDGVSLHDKLNIVDHLHAMFEDTLSFSPLLWSYYGIGPCLLFLLGFKGGGKSTYEDRAFLLYGILNLLAINATLFLISRWQEQVRDNIATKMRVFEVTANLPIHFSYMRRTESVIGRSVTLFLALPIDRSLILAYIGAAITFSTLFLQFK